MTQAERLSAASAVARAGGRANVLLRARLDNREVYVPMEAAILEAREMFGRVDVLAELSIRRGTAGPCEVVRTWFANWELKE